MKMFNLAIVIASVLSTSAFACNSVANTIFSCRTTANKVVEVCDGNGSVRYSYGRTGVSPEKVMQRSYTEVEGYAASDGAGVAFKDGNWEYDVEWGYGGSDHIVAGKIIVRNRDKQIAEIHCARNQRMISEGSRYWNFNNQPR